MNRSLFALVLLATASLVSEAHAEADLILCNSTPMEVSSAIAYETGGSWISRGWYRVQPGECVVPDVSATGPAIYTLARSGDFNWTGSHRFCIEPESAFHYVSTADCRDAADFERHDIGDNIAYTVNFECTDCDFVPTPRYYKNGPPLKVYGRWCGPGYPRGFDPGPPIDAIDTACFQHDQAYVECARISVKEEQLSCELEADSTLMRDFRGITSSKEHDLDPARLAYVGTMIRYLGYQAQLKYQAGEARRFMDQARDSMTGVMLAAGRSVSRTSTGISDKLRTAWETVARKSSEGLARISGNTGTQADTASGD